MKPNLVHHIKQRTNQEAEDGCDGEDDMTMKKYGWELSREAQREVSSTVFKTVIPHQFIKNREGGGEEGCSIAKEWEDEEEKVEEEEGGVDDNVDLGTGEVIYFTNGKV